MKISNITTLHRTYTGYPVIENKPKQDIAKCVVCDNIVVLDRITTMRMLSITTCKGRLIFLFQF